MLKTQKKILIQFAKNSITSKLKANDLKSHEKLVLILSRQSTTCPYNPDELIDTKDTEFEGEINSGNPQRIKKQMTCNYQSAKK